MIHGLTARFCYTCNRTTPNLIVEDSDVGVKVYVCVVHNHVTVGRKAETVSYRVQSQVILEQMPVYDEKARGAD